MSNIATIEKEVGITPLQQLKMDELKYILTTHLGVNANVTELDIKFFLAQCKLFQLDPRKKQIYLLPFGGKYATVIAYTSFLKIAREDANYDGYELKEIISEGKLIGMTCSVFLKNLSKPISRTVYISEYENKNNSMWKYKPCMMLEKTAIAAAHRTAYPDKLENVYEESEQPEPDKNLWYDILDMLKYVGYPYSDDRVNVLNKLVTDGYVSDSVLGEFDEITDDMLPKFMEIVKSAMNDEYKRRKETLFKILDDNGIEYKSQQLNQIHLKLGIAVQKEDILNMHLFDDLKGRVEYECQKRSQPIKKDNKKIIEKHTLINECRQVLLDKFGVEDAESLDETQLFEAIDKLTGVFIDNESEDFQEQLKAFIAQNTEQSLF